MKELLLQFAFRLVDVNLKLFVVFILQIIHQHLDHLDILCLGSKLVKIDTPGLLLFIVFSLGKTFCVAGVKIRIFADKQTEPATFP